MGTWRSGRVVQVHSADRGGGAEAVARLHHGEMIRQGVDARFLVARKLGTDPRVEQIEYVRGPKGARRLAGWFEAVSGRQYVYSPSFRIAVSRLRSDADIAHFHSLHGAEGYAELAPVAWLSRQVPTVVSLHDLWLLTGHCALPLDCDRWIAGCGACPDLKRYPAIRRDGTRGNWLKKKALFESSNIHLIVPSSWVASQVQKSPILSGLRRTVVYNPVDASIFNPGDRIEARRRLGIPTDRITVLVVAQHLGASFKGVADGIKALSQMSGINPYLIAVGGSAESVLAQWKGDGVAVGYQSNQCALVDYYRSSDALIMPSRTETFGMVAAEAMACGTPVIGFATGGLIDVVGDREGGFLVAPGDVNGLAEALRAVLDDAELRARLRASAMARANREFGLEKHTKSCLEIYQALKLAHRSITSGKSSIHPVAPPGSISSDAFH